MEVIVFVVNPTTVRNNTGIIDDFQTFVQPYNKLYLKTY